MRLRYRAVALLCGLGFSLLSYGLGYAVIYLVFAR